MAGASKTTTSNAARSSKRVEAATLKRASDGSAFIRCEACNKSVSVALIDLHSCSLDSKIRETLEAQVVEQAIEKAEKKRKAPAAGKGGGAKKGKAGEGGAKKAKRTPTAYFLFMEDFRPEFRASHPDVKGVTILSKEAGVKWNSMTDEEKKPYVEKAEKLKAEAKELQAAAENGEGSAENDVDVKEDPEQEVEVDQPETVDEDGVEEAKEEEKYETNELDDDI